MASREPALRCGRRSAEKDGAGAASPPSFLPSLPPASLPSAAGRMPRSGPLPAAFSLLLLTAALLPAPSAAQNGEGGVRGAGGGRGARCHGATGCYGGGYGGGRGSWGAEGARRLYSGGGGAMGGCGPAVGRVGWKPRPSSPLPAALPGPEVLRARQSDHLLPPTEPASAEFPSVIYNAIKS